MFSKALSPKTTSEGRLSSLEGKIAQWQIANVAPASSQSGSPALRPSITDMLDSPERGARPPGAPSSPGGLVRAGGSIVARGYDDDGLMYAVELTFHVRPDARETKHTLSSAPSSATSSDG